MLNCITHLFKIVVRMPKTTCVHTIHGIQDEVFYTNTRYIS